MVRKTDSLSHQEKTMRLLRLSHALTICARDTYETGTQRVLEPEILRAYNELLHRVTGAVAGGRSSFESILEMIRDFGEKHNRANAMKWAVDFAAMRN
jgi:hypothetical protein